MRKATSAICCLLSLTLAAACAAVLAGCGASAESEGRARIEALSETTVEDVQAAIDASNWQERVDAFNALLVGDQLPEENANQAFAGTVLIGDSLIEAISGYGILDTDKVVGKVGVSYYSAGPMVTQAAALYPSNVVLAFGENDLDADSGDASLYIESLEPIVQQVRDEIPGAKIFVASVLPSGQGAIEKDANLGHYGEFNQALAAYAASTNDVTYIDTSTVAAEHMDMLEPDEIHYVKAFYPYYLAVVGRAIYS